MRKHTCSSSTFVFGLWLLQGVLIGVLCWVNPNHYTTTDSQYYLQGAQRILEGKGYQVLEENRWVWNGHFPPFYSSCIALVAFILKLPVLWASKLVNWFASGVVVLFLLRKSSSSIQPLLLAILLCSGCCLKLWVHTWSEPLFVVLLLIWIHYYAKGVQAHFWQLVVIGSLLILTRYIGAFLIVFVLIHGVFTQRSDRRKSLILGLIWSMLVIGILVFNYYKSGEIYGGPRFQERTLIIEVIRELSLGLLNELLLFRDLAQGKIAVLNILGMLIQVLFFYKMRTYILFTKKGGLLHFRLAGVYLLCLTMLRIGSSFGPLNYRLLAPFSILILLGWLGSSTLKKGDPSVMYRWIAFFVIMSWLHLLPYTYQK